MESLAAFVAGLFVALIAISALDVVFAILFKRGKLKLWITVSINTVVGLVSLWAVSVYWTLAIPTLAGLLVSSIIITWPRRR